MKTAIIFVALLVAACRATNYQVFSAYTGATCGTVVSQIATVSTTCVAINCIGVGTTSVQTSCSTGVPSLTGALRASTYSVAACVGDPTAITAVTPDVCIGSVGSSTKFSCTAGEFVTEIWTNGDCSGATFSRSAVPVGTGCVTSGTASVGYAGCGGSAANPCFHADSKVSVNGKEPMSMADFAAKKEPTCKVPHQVFTTGVEIATSCGGDPLKVTHDHLMFVEGGKTKAAGDIVVGETLFGSIDEDKKCTVTTVKEISTDGVYYGLNCLESEVLANGLKASTFGKKHTVPAIWMKYVGKVVGIDRASAIGDAIANLASKLGLL